MRYRVQQFVAGVLLLGTVVWGLWLGLWGGLIIPSAEAAIQQLEEAPGQLLYQSRRSLKDQHGNRWQAIAFKRSRADGRAFVYLRLVGFPGVVEIDRTQPVKLLRSLGPPYC
jgi:hypothetical protein